MSTTVPHAVRLPFAIALTAVLFTGCVDEAPLAPDAEAAIPAQFAKAPKEAEIQRVVATLRRVTDRYHNLNVALAEGFVHVHDCEVRPGEGPVGIVYAHPGRLFDGVISASLPDALVYEPRMSGRPRLVGVEMAVPYSMWTREQPPRFLGATFQREDELGVFGLHIWVWRSNPNGLFAPSNPRVSCGPAA